MTKCETAICQLAVNVYGKTSQCTVCMEEMAELTKELSKNLRGQDNAAHIAEEIADVEIMLEQLKLKELGADVEQWQKEVLANEPKTLGKR